MASSYGNMTLRERTTEAERKQRKSPRNEERSQDGIDSNERDGKKTKKIDRRGAKYDSQGIHKETQKDICDCLIDNCPGCFMPCRKCSSNKCGHECRRNRRWVYEMVEIEGKSSESQIGK